MENELQILNNIENNKNATQRDIAKKTGMSLGSVNVLIKRLVKKGMLKIERLNPKTIRYILTPEGMKEKAESTYRYIVNSYKYINEVIEKIDKFINNQICDGKKQILLFGYQDEFFQLLINKLNQKRMNYEYAGSIEELEKLLVDNELSDKSSEGVNKVEWLILVWHPDCQNSIEQKNVKFFNLLENI